MATNLPSCFFIQFLEQFLHRTTLEVSSKLYFVEICQVSEKSWLFNHKRADFWLPKFEFERSLLSFQQLNQSAIKMKLPTMPSQVNVRTDASEQTLQPEITCFQVLKRTNLQR